jgi:hypothetical protein
MKMVDENKAALARELLRAGSGLRSVAQATGLHRNTVAKLKSEVVQNDNVPSVPVVNVPVCVPDELAHTLRSMQWAIDVAAESLKQNGLQDYQVEDTLRAVRSICNDLRKQYPVAKVVHTVNVPVVNIDPLAVDPLTLI